MVGAEHVDEVPIAAFQLVVVLGDVAGKVGVAAVGFLQGAVGVVAEGA